MVDEKTIKIMEKAQKNEITESKIYSWLAKKTNDEYNKKILEGLSRDEKKHYEILKKHTNKDFRPDKIKVFVYCTLATILGVSFTLKLMEKGEEYAQKIYNKQKNNEFAILVKDEHKHEKALIKILKDERVEYAGSIVLGLNDALVELTGALAGLSLALANGKLIAVIGGITGFAAALSMAASEYLSSKEDKQEGKSELRGATYTGIAYVVTVALLIMPFIFISNVLVAMGTMLVITITIIASYTFYITTAKDTKFWPKFMEMAIISLSVAAISFVVGWLVKNYIGIDI